MQALDDRLGRLLRLIRQRGGRTQEQLATAAKVPERDVSLVETGRVGEVRVDRVRRMFAAADGQVRLTAWWNGAAADRLLDERHASMGERAGRVIASYAWQTLFEVSFSEFGERGSIDILAASRSARAVAVFEVKSDWGSLEETNRVLDVKTRLAPKITLQRFGWRPAVIGRVLILPDETSARRVVTVHRTTMAAVYHARSREVREWLRDPDRNISGIWFLSNPRISRTKSDPDG